MGGIGLLGWRLEELFCSCVGPGGSLLSLMLRVVRSELIIFSCKVRNYVMIS